MSVVVSLADLKEYLGITDTTYDTVLQDILDQVEAEFKLKYGVEFAPITVTGGIFDYHHERDNFKLDLGKKPLSGTFTLELNEAGPDAAPSWTTLTRKTSSAYGDYYLDMDKGKVWFINEEIGYDDYQNVRITYTYGWASGAAVPDNVKQLLLLLAAKDAITARGGISIYTSQDSVRIGEIAVSKGGNALATALKTLDDQIARIMDSINWLTPEAAVMV
jgi:hypothetical protein